MKLSRCDSFVFSLLHFLPPSPQFYDYILVFFLAVIL
jgi:hypothetical protein